MHIEVAQPRAAPPSPPLVTGKEPSRAFDASLAATRPYTFIGVRIYDTIRIYRYRDLTVRRAHGRPRRDNSSAPAVFAHLPGFLLFLRQFAGSKFGKSTTPCVLAHGVKRVIERARCVSGSYLLQQPGAAHDSCRQFIIIRVSRARV